MTNERLQKINSKGIINMSWVARKYHNLNNGFDITDREGKAKVAVFYRDIQEGRFNKSQLRRISKIIMELKRMI